MYRKSYNDFRILSNSWNRDSAYKISGVMKELNKCLLWFWTLRIDNFIYVLFITTYQLVCKFNQWFITVEKRKILNLLFMVTLMCFKNHWTLQSTLQKWRHKNKITEKKFVKSQDPEILGQIIDDKMLWSKSEHFETCISEPKTKSVIIEVRLQLRSIEINLLENWT